MQLTITAPIRGNHFRPASAKTVYNELEWDEELSLEPEPENQYDENAIKVLARGEHVGYVGKEFAAELSGANLISGKYEGSGMMEITYEPSE
jgi:hypothetical protein